MWLPEDLDAVLEYQRWRDEVCSGCGQPMSETLDAELEGAYEPRVVQCHGCAARDTAMKKSSDQPGVKVAVELLPEAHEYLRDRRVDG